MLYGLSIDTSRCSLQISVLTSCLKLIYFKVPMKLKNNSCLLERLFKVKKNSVFLFGISFFVLEIFTFLYYANEGK